MSTGSLGSAKRALQIFELFAEIRRPASVTEVWRTLGHPQSSTSKLLKLMATMGYLRYDGENRQYVPTLRTAFLGSWLHDQWFSNISLLGVMEGIRERLGTSVILAVQNDVHALYMLTLMGTLEGFHHPRPDLRVGALRPICQVAVGKALLMDWDEASIGRLVRRINAEESDPSKHIHLRKLLDGLAESRERGYVFNSGTFLPEVAVMAMPLPQLSGQPRMAFGLGAPIDWFSEHLEEAEQVLRSALLEVQPTVA